MALNAAQRTVTFPPRDFTVPMSVRINERIAEQQQTRASLVRTPIVALALGKVSQHLVIAEHQAETLTEKLALGTYLCGDNRALLDEALECATRVVGALSFCKKKAVDHETRIFAEYEARELAIVEESQPRDLLNGADVDGRAFVPGNFFADTKPTALCPYCEAVIWTSLDDYEVINGEPHHCKCSKALGEGCTHEDRQVPE